jgi:bifunctional non-homologous end joining protein LigD
VAAARTAVTAHGRDLSLSNLDKVLYPETGFTKGDLVAYYEAIGEVIVPHLRGRATTLVRCPEGVDGERFFEKMCPKHRPDWVGTVDVWAPSPKRTVRYCRIDEPAAVVWTAQLAAIELHPGLLRDDDRETPTHLVVDLDPGEPAGLLECIEVAQLVRERLARGGLDCLAKVSGSKGIQVLAPLAPPCDFEALRDVALALAEGLAEDHPDQIVTNMRKDLRPGKVLIDWSQNSAFKTTVATWSVRARVRPWVSVPVTWDELAAAHDAGDPERLRFEAPQALARARQGDPMADAFAHPGPLPPAASLRA